MQQMTDYDKFFPDGFSLETEKVLLRIMKMEDVPGFLAVSQSPDLWKYFTKELNDEKQLTEWVDEALKDRLASKRVPFTVMDKQSRSICGSTSFGNISFFDRRIEIGWTWVGEQFLGSGINHHCKYALLKYAFESMLFERVEIKTDVLNNRARQALKKLGAIEEGILRSHMQMPHGRRRDSIYYSILKTEWQGAKAKYFIGVIQP